MLLELCMSSKCDGYAQKGEAKISEEAERLGNSDITLPISLLENGGSSEVNCHSGFHFLNVL